MTHTRMYTTEIMILRTGLLSAVTSMSSRFPNVTWPWGVRLNTLLLLLLKGSPMVKHPIARSSCAQPEFSCVEEVFSAVCPPTVRFYIYIHRYTRFGITRPCRAKIGWRVLTCMSAGGNCGGLKPLEMREGDLSTFLYAYVLYICVSSGVPKHFSWSQKLLYKFGREFLLT